MERRASSTCHFWDRPLLGQLRVIPFLSCHPERGEPKGEQSEGPVFSRCKPAIPEKLPFQQTPTLSAISTQQPRILIAGHECRCVRRSIPCSGHLCVVASPSLCSLPRFCVSSNRSLKRPHLRSPLTLNPRRLIPFSVRFPPKSKRMLKSS